MNYSLEGKIFRSVANSDSGEVNADTLFYYRQHGDIVTADYSGGRILAGHLIARVLADGRLDMRYHHLNANGEFMLGKCISTPERLPDGRLRFKEQWQWLSGDLSAGDSEIAEVASHDQCAGRIYAPGTSRETNEMQISDMLMQTGGVQAMSKELGISETDAARGAAALAPAILGGFQKEAQAQRSGVEGLGGLLGQLGGGSLLDNVLAPQPTDVNRGNDVLGHIFGSKDVSRTVAENASAQTGIDQSLLKKMLPIVTMMIAGYMAKQRSGGTSPATTSGNAGVGGLLGGLLGGAGGGASGGLSSMFDTNRDGNPLDDILRMASKRGR